MEVPTYIPAVASYGAINSNQCEYVNECMPYLEQESRDMSRYQQVNYIIIQRQCVPNLPIVYSVCISSSSDPSSLPRIVIVNALAPCKELLKARRCSSSSTVPLLYQCLG
jgi:hypothetical protein